jgi:uncharacterized Zn-binding protein involved in type VI secretion
MGAVASGCTTVLVGGQPAARKSDVTAHGGVITTGCPTVVIGGSGLIAARMKDEFTCPCSDESGTHTGGMITPPACVNVLIGGLGAARTNDPTLCTGPALVMGGDGKGEDTDASECAKLWQECQDEAQKILDPVDHDHRERNKAISGAYADLYLNNPEFQWCGLAGYASKQVGCAMDHAKSLKTPPPNPAVAMMQTSAISAAADYTLEMLGKGNRNLFLDIYPMHSFFAKHGWAKMSACAGARTPPMTPWALEGFEAIQKSRETGDRSHLRESVKKFAMHEQINILQRDIYDDQMMQVLLDANEEFAWMPGGLNKPADVIMGSGCSVKPGDKIHKFAKEGRDDLYDVPQRMEWILDDIGSDYFNNLEGTDKHKRDMEDIRNEGKGAGATYPPVPAKSAT